MKKIQKNENVCSQSRRTYIKNLLLSKFVKGMNDHLRVTTVRIRLIEILLIARFLQKAKNLLRSRLKKHPRKRKQPLPTPFNLGLSHLPKFPLFPPLRPLRRSTRQPPLKNGEEMPIGYVQFQNNLTAQ